MKNIFPVLLTCLFSVSAFAKGKPIYCESDDASVKVSIVVNKAGRLSAHIEEWSGGGEDVDQDLVYIKFTRPKEGGAIYRQTGAPKNSDVTGFLLKFAPYHGGKADLTMTSSPSGLKKVSYKMTCPIG